MFRRWKDSKDKARWIFFDLILTHQSTMSSFEGVALAGNYEIDNFSLLIQENQNEVEEA